MKKGKFIGLEIIFSIIYCAISEFVLFYILWSNVSFVSLGSTNPVMDAIAQIVFVILIIGLIVASNIIGKRKCISWKLPEIIISIIIWLLALPIGGYSLFFIICFIQSI